MTVFACTDGLAGRWILRGRYIEPDETLVTYALKWEFYDLLVSLEEMDAAKKKDVITKVLGLIEQKRSILSGDLDYHDKYKKYLFNYFEKKLLALY